MFKKNVTSIILFCHWAQTRSKEPEGSTNVYQLPRLGLTPEWVVNPDPDLREFTVLRGKWTQLPKMHLSHNGRAGSEIVYDTSQSPACTEIPCASFEKQM